ncbi:MAG: BON domain-containing protein [Nitrospirales bacterium]|nr:BON domain-containing protein [Nitrospira sp.]MDR4501109.1 BON domain-containing protein [Nitrospirales bacterium]
MLKMVVAALLGLFGAVTIGTGVSASDAPPSAQATEQKQRDDQIKYDVEDRLRTDGRIDWEVLDVEVKHGHVTLYGEVRTQEEKGFATDIAIDVAGVTEIFNRIIVDVPPSKDHNLQKAVWETLRGVDVLQTDPLRVRARNGVVTLSGVVETEREKEAAQRAVESVSGVEKVINAIHTGAPPLRSEQETLLKQNRQEVE